MKRINIFLMLTTATFALLGQRQLDIQGTTTSIDTVATIRVNSVASADVVGLAVYSAPQLMYGTAGDFYGGFRGVLGRSTTGTGLHGTSVSGQGIFGQSDSGFGVVGHCPMGYGLYGLSDSGYGVYGYSLTGFGMFGFSDSSEGVYGKSDSGNGVKGESSAGDGVYGTSVYGHGVYGQNDSSGYGVYGLSQSGAGVHGTSPSGTGVYGFSESWYGVHGKSTRGNGVLGWSEAIGGYGVYGIAESEAGIAVYGKSVEGNGIYGKTTRGIGVYGESETAEGVYGYSNSSFGINGYSKTSNGIYGYSESSSGIRGHSGAEYGIYGTSYSETGAYFYGGGGVAIELGGEDSPWGQDQDDCVIRTQADDQGSDLIMVANDVISFQLDDDNNSTSGMLVYNGHDHKNPIFLLDESGNLTITGTYSPSSDVNRKENFTEINTNQILDKVLALPISEWQFKGENARHLGPMAQDFFEAFGLGASSTTIATVDADGIALAAIQALAEQNASLHKRIEELVDLNSHLECKLSQLRGIVEEIIRD